MFRLFSGILSGIYSDISYNLASILNIFLTFYPASDSDILSGILPGIYSDISYGLAFILNIFLTFYPASDSDILSGILSGICSVFSCILESILAFNFSKTKYIVDRHANDLDWHFFQEKDNAGNGKK